MNNRAKILIYFLLTVTLFALTGCNLPSAEQNSFQTRVAGTVAAENAVNPSAEIKDIQPPPPENPIPTLTATLSPTFTLTPTITASPTITLTSTLEAPMASVSTNTNCRTGPDTVFDNIGALLVGEQAEVVGQTIGGWYWIIKNPDRSGECWLWAHYATVTGPTEGLPFYDPPPTPTPAFNWSGVWSVMIGPAEGGFHTSHTMNTAVTGRAFTGSIDFGGVVITYNGTISDDYLSVSGNWQEDVDETGPFKLYAQGASQFQGNYSDGGAFALCGTRSGFGFPPSPCYRP